MFGLGPATWIYVALGATDMRKGFDGNYGLDRATLSHEELWLLLGGIDLTRTRRKDWYRKTIPDGEKA